MQLMTEILSSSFASRWQGINQGRHFLQDQGNGTGPVAEERGEAENEFDSYRKEWEAVGEEQSQGIVGVGSDQVGVAKFETTSPIAKAREAWSAEMEEQDKILTHAEKLLSGAEQAIARMHQEDDRGGAGKDEGGVGGVGVSSASGGGGSDALQGDVLLPAPGSFSDLAALRTRLGRDEASSRPSRAAPEPGAGNEEGDVEAEARAQAQAQLVVEKQRAEAADRASKAKAEVTAHQHAVEAATAAAALITAAAERSSITDHVARALSSRPLTLSKIVNPGLTLGLRSFYDSTPYPGNASIEEIRERVATLRSQIGRPRRAKEGKDADLGRVEEKRGQQQQQQRQVAIVPTTVANTNPEWVELVEPRTMRKVFFNASMNETRWDSPSGPTFRPSQGQAPAFHPALSVSLPFQQMVPLPLPPQPKEEEEEKEKQHSHVEDTATAAEAAAIAEKAIELHNIKALARERAKE